MLRETHCTIWDGSLGLRLLGGSKKVILRHMYMPFILVLAYIGFGVGLAVSGFSVKQSKPFAYTSDRINPLVYSEACVENAVSMALSLSVGRSCFEI